MPNTYMNNINCQFCAKSIYNDRYMAVCDNHHIKPIFISMPVVNKVSTIIYNMDEYFIHVNIDENIEIFSMKPERYNLIASLPYFNVTPECVENLLKKTLKLKIFI